jgi:hypothetical protein
MAVTSARVRAVPPEVVVHGFSVVTITTCWSIFTSQLGATADRSVSKVAADLGCDWHTAMDAVTHYGTPLIDNPNRIGNVTAIGHDEALSCRPGPFRQPGD